MPKRSESITLASTPDVEADIATICAARGLDPQARGAAQRVIRYALARAAAEVRRQVGRPPRQEQEGSDATNT